MACCLRLAASASAAAPCSDPFPDSSLVETPKGAGRTDRAWFVLSTSVPARRLSPCPALLRLLAINNRYREASIKISVDCTPLLVSMRKRKLRVAPCYSVAHSRCNAKG